MFVISAEEFRQQTLASPSKHEKKYQDKLLTVGPVFSQKNQQLALEYCQKYHQRKKICLVVEEPSYLQIWCEDNKSASHIKSQSSFNNEKITNDASNNINLEHKIIINQIFIDRCQQILVELIGPIATIICKRTATQNPNIEQSRFIELIAKQIPEPQKAEEFKKQLLD